MIDKIKIIYTSDVHGTLHGFNYANQKNEKRGLASLKTYLKTQKNEYILIENGDMLQGSPLLDYNRTRSIKNQKLVAKVINNLNYNYVNLGNHDFNYGVEHLKNYLDQLKAKNICNNVLFKNTNQKLGNSQVHVTKNGIKIAIIGAVTHYIPNFEKPENIKNLKFIDAFAQIKKEIIKFKKIVDAIVVVYHGGFERDLKNGSLIVNDTGENQGYKILKINEINVLLTGHQHVPQVHNISSKKTTIQTGLNNYDFGEVNLEFKKIKNKWELKKVYSNLIKNDFKQDKKIIDITKEDHDLANLWLDKKISYSNTDISISDPLSCRIFNHPMFQLINKVQLELTKADLSLASLPNNPPGFKKVITMRDVAANFIYPNSLVVLEINGKILKSALEKNSEYFVVKNNKIEINKKYLIPKIEHYNYDLFSGIEYEIKASNPPAKKIIKLTYKGKPVLDDQKFTIVMNNYRAAGGGDYFMYKNAKILKEYQENLSDLIIAFLRKNPKLEIQPNNNFSVKI